MARTAVTPTVLGPNSATVDPAAGDTIDATLVTNGVVISGVPLEELIIVVDQQTAATDTVTIRAGASPPALEAGQGDLTQDLDEDEVGWFGPFTSGRFAQADGSIHVDFSAGMTGSIWAYHVPRSA